MKILQIVLSYLFFASAFMQSIPAEAWIHGSAGISVDCPYGYSNPDDGCQALTSMNRVGSFSVPDAFTNSLYGPGSGQTYLNRLLENQAGVDFKVGITQSVLDAGLLDPTTANLSGTNCTYDAKGSQWGSLSVPSTSGGVLTWSSLSGVIQQGARVNFNSGAHVSYVGTQIDATHWNATDINGNPDNANFSSSSATITVGPKLTCASAVYVHGFDFSAINGHMATVLKVGATATSVDIQDNNFFGDVNTTNASGQGDYAITMGPGVGSSANVNFSHNTVDGNCHSQTCDPTVGGWNWSLYTSGARTVEYNAFKWMPYRITAGCGSNSTSCIGNTMGDLHFRWNIWVGMTNSNASSHGEVIEDILAQFGSGTTLLNTLYVGNVIIIPKDTAPITTTIFYISGGATPVGPARWVNVTVSDSTLIINKSSGATVASAIIDFQNGHYTNVLLKNLRIDAIGAIANFRFDCNQALFNGAIDGTTGILTVTSWISSWKTIATYGNADNSPKIAIGNTGTGNRILDQITGTAGQNGTYDTDYRGVNIAQTSMETYGAYGMATLIDDATGLPGTVTMTNVQDMKVAPGTNITTFDFKNFCSVYGPP